MLLLKESLNERLIIFRKDRFPFLVSLVKSLIVNRKKYPDSWDIS